MKLKVMTIHVDDQAKALRFYTEVLGLKKKTDVSNHGYRWVTVASPEQPDGPELQIEANTDPAAKAYQEARFQKGQPALRLFVDDVQAEYDRIKGQGATFKMAPTKTMGSTIAQLEDGCGNILQLTALDHRG
jgi:predicted enzyme related to lactoylglutathione lyase